MRILIRNVFIAIFAFLAGSLFCQAGPKSDKSGVIDCINGTFTSVGETDLKRNEVHEGKYMSWYLVGSAQTKVEISFAAKAEFPTCQGTSPFDPGTALSKVITNSGFKPDILKSGKVLNGKGSKDPATPNCYSYSIVCKPQADESTWKTIDPIIDVPKP